LERRAAAVPFDPTALALPLNVSGGGSGRPVDTMTALGIGTFFRGVELIANDLSYLPLRAMKQRADGTREPFTEATAPGIVTNPFLGLTLAEGMKQLLTSRIIRGNAYMFPGKVIGGEVLQWMIVSPDAVQCEWAKDHSTRVYRLGGKVYNGPVIHVAGFMLPGAPTGIGVLEAHRMQLGLTASLTESASMMFANGIMSSGIISMDAPMSQDNARAVAESFRQNHAGVKKAHVPIVLGGGAKYQQLSISPNDAQFLESRQFQQGEIATLLGIPPHLLGIVDRTTSWGEGIEAQNRGYYDHTLKSYVKQFEAMFTSLLPANVWASFDTDELIRADTQTRYQNYETALNNGFLNPDEIRAREGLPPLPGGLGQIFRQSVQSVPAGTAAPAAIPTGAPATAEPATAITTGAN
jgi:HK97 family phage portal protein